MKFKRKPVQVVSANFLERVGEPASPFYSDFLAYRNGQITQAELITRLPHVAMVGDSACTGVYISSMWGTFWRARTCGNNWFLDTNPAPTGFRAFRKNWRSSLHLLRLNAQASARSSTMKASGRIFSEEFFGRAISPAKLATC
jgi:hypothetical protein